MLRKQALEMLLSAEQFQKCCGDLTSAVEAFLTEVPCGGDFQNILHWMRVLMKKLHLLVRSNERLEDRDLATSDVRNMFIKFSNESDVSCLQDAAEAGNEVKKEFFMKQNSLMSALDAMDHLISEIEGDDYSTASQIMK